MGIHHALTATQMLDLATGKDGAVDAGTHTTARALYEQMLEVLGGLVGARTTRTFKTVILGSGTVL